MQFFDDRFQAESGWNLTLLGSGHQKPEMKLTSAEYAIENSR
jgi:hypothetical protein